MIGTFTFTVRGRYTKRWDAGRTSADQEWICFSTPDVDPLGRDYISVVGDDRIDSPRGLAVCVVSWLIDNLKLWEGYAFVIFSQRGYPVATVARRPDGVTDPLPGEGTGPFESFGISAFALHGIGGSDGR